MSSLKLTTRLYLASAILVAVAIAIGVLGLFGLHRTDAALDTVYADCVIPLKQLKAISDDYAVAIIDAVNKANAGLATAEEMLKGVDAATANIRKNWKEYTATKLTKEEEKLAAEANALFAPANAAVARLRETVAGKSGSLKGELANFDGPLYQQIDPISGKITELVDLQLREAQLEYDAAGKRYELTFNLSLVLLVAGVAAGGGLCYFVVRSITRELRRVTAQLASGSAHTAAAAHEVAGASHLLAEGSSEQAASLEETSASLEEISSMTKRNSENASNASALGRQTRDSATVGLERIAGLNTTLGAIRTAVGEMQAAVGEIQTSSREVARIIKTIDEIAFQTNLLALNASVEAARAGEAGMGFAVVADEVRALAQRSAQAASDTASRIEAAVKRSEIGGAASLKVVNSLTEVEATAGSIEQSFNGIVGQIKTLDEIVAEIAAASTEQSQGVTEVNMAVSQMDKVTQSNAAAAEENAGAATEMNDQARALQQLVSDLEHLMQGTREKAKAFSPPAVLPAPGKHPALAPKPAVAASAARSPFAAKSPAKSAIPMPELAEAGSPAGGFTQF